MEMTKHIRSVGLASLAVLAIGAVASAPASATTCTSYCWKVGGNPLEAGEEGALKGDAAGSYTLTLKYIGFIEISITCNSAEARGALVGGEPGKAAATIKYTGCSSSSCTPHEPVETKAKSEVVLYAEGGKKYWGELFTAKESSGVFAAFECSGLRIEISGGVVGELLNEASGKIEIGHEAEEAFGYVRFTGANSAAYTNEAGEEGTAELKWEGKAATLKGTTLVALNSGRAFGPGE
jgi:hypothetical protein